MTPVSGLGVQVTVTFPPARSAVSPVSRDGLELGRRHIDGVPLRASVCDRLEELKELRRAQVLSLWPQYDG